MAGELRGNTTSKNVDPGDLKLQSVALSIKENWRLMILFPLLWFLTEDGSTLLEVMVFPKLACPWRGALVEIFLSLGRQKQHLDLLFLRNF